MNEGNCYFCGRLPDHEHHILPVAVGEAFTDLSQGSFQLRSIKKVDLCDECHIKFHKLVQPLRLLGLLETKVYIEEATNSLRDRAQYVMGTILQLQEKTGYGAVSRAQLQNEFQRNFLPQTLNETLSFLEKNGFIYETRPEWFKTWRFPGTERETFRELEKALKQCEPANLRSTT